MTEVLAEHFDYLSLNGREQLYGEAIARVLNPGDVVADLGCGFGILGIQCLRAGASKVYGIDATRAITIARESVARAGLADRYNCIHGSTYRTQLPEQVDLVICDHVGWFGLDYDIIPMLEDARRRMLKPGGKVLPQRIRLMVAGVSSDKCRAMASQWSAPPIPEEYHWLDDYQRNTKHSREFAPEEICTAPVAVGEIDLTIDNPDVFSFSADLAAMRDVRLDGIAGWVECELADGIWMTNSPLAERRIARNQVFLAARESFALRGDETARISLTCRKEGAMIGWSITPPNGQPRQKLSTFNALVLGDEDLPRAGGSSLALNPHGGARRALLDLVDGVRTGTQIEQAVIEAFPALFPTEAEIRRFVQTELGRNTQC